MRAYGGSAAVEFGILALLEPESGTSYLVLFQTSGDPQVEVESRDAVRGARECGGDGGSFWHGRMA